MEEALEARGLVLRDGIDEGDLYLAEAAKRDPAAFGELYERYYARIYRYVYHRTPSASDAEDITAVVFVKALEALPGYRPGRNGFAPWLFCIARNAVVDYYRRRRKQSPLDALEHHSGDDDPVGHVLEDEQRIELRTLVEGLSADQRDVVLMRFAADLSYPEIASVMNKNEPAIRMLLHRGLRKLKAVMNDE
jgi:RNA polymerase sigma-70 factor (ECF subfamily)